MKHHSFWLLCPGSCYIQCWVSLTVNRILNCENWFTVKENTSTLDMILKVIRMPRDNLECIFGLVLLKNNYSGLLYIVYLLCSDYPYICLIPWNWEVYRSMVICTEMKVELKQITQIRTVTQINLDNGGTSHSCIFEIVIIFWLSMMKLN